MEEQVTTPMMKQYLAIKKQYQDCLVLYRMGDFYELFQEDAYIGVKVLNITLTGKANGKGGRIPMAGVPYHAVDAYLAKLVKAGYKVAICEQLTPPNKKGLVLRDVVRIVTPGTMLDEKALEQKDNNYIISLALYPKELAIAIADISTGYFAVSSFTTEHIAQTIRDELVRLHPAECILPESLYNNPEILGILHTQRSMSIYPFLQWEEYANSAQTVLQEHFSVATLEGFGIHDAHCAKEASAALLGYLQQTQKGPVQHIKKMQTFTQDASLALDRSTIINLELFTTLRDHETKGTLLSVVDQTATPMGGRMIKQWMRKPLCDKSAIEERYDAVEELLGQEQLFATIRQKTEEISDIERLIARLSVGLGNARDLINLKNTLQVILSIKSIVAPLQSILFGELVATIDPRISEIVTLIETTINPESPISIREGGMIQNGINAQLDSLRDIVSGSKEWIIALERLEREKTGIATLKVRFNQVFGFYIEVSKAHLGSVPAAYMRKQTLVNAERFITPELKEKEEIILTAEEKINDIEYTMFQELLKKVLAQVALMQDAAQSIATLDCLMAFAYNAKKRNYCRPQLRESGDIHIHNGRHPVVETLLSPTEQFVPNSVTLDTSQQLLVITGPNMAGKSVFIRQIAQLVLLAQMGSFIPADEAQIGIMDHIFVRSGASDVITSGLSTFMVEMVETAHILHHATDRSLIVMDEIGRGTSTFDGISIAWAIAEYLVTNAQMSPKTLFATHYHELQSLEEKYPDRIKNYHMAVAQQKGEPVFLHTLQRGSASHSFGVAVAKLAGLPPDVVLRAKVLLDDLEKRNTPHNEEVIAPTQRDLADHMIHTELAGIDISQMTPLEALNTLAKMKEKVKIFNQNDQKSLQFDKN